MASNSYGVPGITTVCGQQLLWSPRDNWLATPTVWQPWSPRDNHIRVLPPLILFSFNASILNHVKREIKRLGVDAFHLLRNSNKPPLFISTACGHYFGGCMREYTQKWVWAIIKWAIINNGSSLVWHSQTLYPMKRDVRV